MKKLYILSLLALGASSGLVATSHKTQTVKEKTKTDEKNMMKKAHKSSSSKESKKILKNMINEAYLVEKDNKKYVGYFMRTNDGKTLLEKVEINLKEKTPEEIQKHTELKTELKDKFHTYLQKKDVQMKQK